MNTNIQNELEIELNELNESELSNIILHESTIECLKDINNRYKSAKKKSALDLLLDVNFTNQIMGVK